MSPRDRPNRHGAGAPSGRIEPPAPPDTGGTSLARAVARLTAAHPGRSGIVPLVNGRDAFAARVLLIDAAQRSLDVQYYIWERDMSGTLLFEAVHRAAQRGVRVRLLLDDNNTHGLDASLAALNAHPNIEVRLFNPFVNRRWRALGYLTDFSRLNRRMHNKSCTVDNQATVIGGRNVGDAYFDAAKDMLFADLDVTAIGPVVAEVAADFDRYWESESAYPAERVLPELDAAALERLTRAASLVERDPAAAEYMRAIHRLPFVRDLLAGEPRIEWVSARMVSDHPAKGTGDVRDDALLLPRLLDAMGTPARRLQLVSAYFVPTAAGVETLAALARRGVRIEILTNALEATDVAVVHAGYAKRRRALLEAGVVLYELKREAAGQDPRGHRLGGSSASSLHAKTFAVDGERVFVGSFNFDPRSARLNTEMGFVLDSRELAEAMADAFAEAVPRRAYRVRLTDSGRLQWLEQRERATVAHDTEPGTAWWQRLMVRVISLLPIEWLL